MCNSVNQRPLYKKIIVKDSSVNDFDLLTQAFVYYVSNMDTKTFGKKQN